MRKILLLSLLIMLLFGFLYLKKNSFIATAYAAKKACGCHLLAERTLKSIYQEDLDRFPLNLVSISIDHAQQKVEAKLFGLWKSVVVKTKAKGCVLITQNKKPLEDFSNEFQKSNQIEQPIKLDLLDQEKLDLAFQLAFDKEDEFLKKTRALLVFYRDTLVREKYAEGFDKHTRILGWSMNKSIAHALIGILVKNGKLKLTDTNLFEEWDGDERSKISVNDLLQMSSGLDWDEDYSTKSDATNLLFGEFDCSDFAIAQPLEAPPGTFWEYSSGTTNILSKLIRNQFNNDEQYLKFPYDSLFNRLGMSSIILDTDQSGNYILSSYGYATPRDWAKFGLLYLNNGMWQGQEILSQDWIQHASTPAINSINKIYGAHFWLNAGGEYQDVPLDMYSCNGYQGQFIYIIPSKELVVVRMGLSEGEEYDKNGVLKYIVESVEAKKKPAN